MWKGFLTYTFQTVSNPPQYQSLDCAQRKLGAPIKKNSTYKPSPIHTLSKDTKDSALEYTIWAYFGNNQRVSSLVFQRSPIIIVVGLYEKFKLKEQTIIIIMEFKKDDWCEYSCLLFEIKPVIKSVTAADTSKKSHFCQKKSTHKGE